MAKYGRPQNFWKTLKRLLSYMGKHSFLFFVIMVLVAVSGLANLFGVFMIRPIVNALGEGQSEQAMQGILIMAIIFTCGVLSSLGYTQIMAKAAQEVVKDLRHDLFEKMESLPIKVFDSTSHGDIMSRFTNDIDTVSDALNNSFAMMIQAFIQAVGTLVLLFVLNWRLSLIVSAFYIIMMVYIRISGNTSKKYFSRQQKQLGILNGFVEEMISGQKVVKVFNHEVQNELDFKDKSAALQTVSQKAQSFAQTMVPMVVSLSYVNYAIVTIVGGLMVWNGSMDLGSLASYLVFVRQAAMPINQFTQQSNMLLVAISGAERIFDFMTIPEEKDQGVVTFEYVDGKPMWLHPRRTQPPEYVPVKGEVEFVHVDFGYSAHHPILHDISVLAQPGQKIAFVGATGAGKTTITNLINRFYDIQKGQILLDGIDIQLFAKKDLRRSLGIVLQDTHLFTGTIKDNIRFGKEDASMEEVIQAAKLANAHSFIERLPNGYETIITNDGASLSQGQRQLIAIARTAIIDPPVLILDEATSSIDTRTEKLIEKGMDALMEGRTVFVIAHRLSTIQNADTIVVLEKGRIMEEGSHQQLLQKKGMYYQLHEGMFELS
ncbi:ABC transporter ATP-binding protein [Dubosiella newyorkensis]|uniref:Multidrug ABC transporter ATP-binding protein n=2 Tax=Dubosiella newyorkensis TaxID=1862672 RepID=A0A1U7NQS7_9FIRM|nr:ABC transporter ATP-binding protein [Dubosiella newyorkensis]OLU47991.1 multidrug ABC transporter ATP-binding protein [Dubosiella newyorkensis]